MQINDIHDLYTRYCSHLDGFSKNIAEFYYALIYSVFIVENTRYKLYSEEQSLLMTH